MKNKNYDMGGEYTGSSNSHYRMPSSYAKLLREQNTDVKKTECCDPGPATGEMKASKTGNPQVGP